MSEWISIYDKSKEPEVGEVYVCWMHKLQEPVCCRFSRDEHGPLWLELVEVDIFLDREDLITHYMGPITKPPED